MINKPLFIMTGLSVGLVMSCCTVTFFHYAQKDYVEKRRIMQIILVICFLIFGFGSILLSAYIWESGVFGNLGKSRKGLFFALWLIPCASTAIFSGIKICIKQKKEPAYIERKKQEEQAPIPSAWRLLWVIPFPCILYIDFFAVKESILLGSYDKTNMKILFIFLWSLPGFVYATKLLIRIFRKRQLDKCT